MRTVEAMKKADFSRREFPMTETDFKFIAKMANENTGIQLGVHKQDMVYSRIVRRIRALKLRSFSEYCTYLKTHQDSELVSFINSITTNLTSFFREQHHFDFLLDRVIPEVKKKNASSRKLRIWSAGCSTGEEPYSLAMTLHKAFSKENWDVKVLATDLDTSVVAHGKAGIYTVDRVGDLAATIIKNNFNKVVLEDNKGASYEVSPHLKEFITFNQLNLLKQWPMKGKFDVIFCRNVVIYFNKDTQKVLFDRYAEMLRPNGYLFIGHSETLHSVTDRFESLGKTIYRKIR